MTAPSKIDQRALGSQGEDLAAEFFRRRGFQILARNWRCGDGELDLVVLRSGVVRVIEVKTRRSFGAGYPEEAVTDEKLEHLSAAWHRFVVANPALPDDVHFDVLTITFSSKGYPIYRYLPDIE